MFAAYGRVEGNECRCSQTPGAVAGAGWAGRAALPLCVHGTRPGQARDPDRLPARATRTPPPASGPSRAPLFLHVARLTQRSLVHSFHRHLELNGVNTWASASGSGGSGGFPPVPQFPHL